MQDKELLLKIVDDKKNEILNSDNYQRYLAVINILEKINVVYDDVEKITVLDDRDLLLLDESSKKIVECINYLVGNNSGDIEEIRNSLMIVKKQLNEQLGSNIIYYEGLGKTLNDLKLIEDSILSNMGDNYSLMLDFIKMCYREKSISLEEAISLNLYVVEQCCNNREVLDNNEVEIEDNAHSIYEELVDVFRKYGYDYEGLTKRMKIKFNEYAKVDYTDYVLSVLNLYGVTQNDLLENQKAIFRIIIDSDNNTLDKICEFIDKNDCSLANLLSFDSIFHKRKRQYYSKNNRSKSGDLKLDQDLLIKGSFDDFCDNIRFLQSRDGDVRITDDFLKKKKIFICTSNDKIRNNLRLLINYGICNEGELPDDLSCLIGNYTAYQLDHFIEVGLYDYIKDNVSYVNRTKSPFKFYKIRRGNDLGDIVTSNRGMKKKYTDDSISANGISYMDENGGRVIQEKLSSQELSKIPLEYRRDVNVDKDDEKFYFNKLYRDGYWYQQFTPDKIFSRYSSTNLASLINSIFLTDDYSADYCDDGVLNDYYIMMLDKAYCKTTYNGEFYEHNIKKDDNTYEFRPMKFPNIVITISRQKVLRLCSLLKKNNLWLNDSYSIEDNVNILLSVMIKDSVLSYWEFNYLRSIVKMLVNNVFFNENAIDKRGGR